MDKWTGLYILFQPGWSFARIKLFPSMPPSLIPCRFSFLCPILPPPYPPPLPPHPSISPSGSHLSHNNLSFPPVPAHTCSSPSPAPPTAAI
ncbi:unnamed protein product [Closterium sp. NIES-53]